MLRLSPTKGLTVDLLSEDFNASIEEVCKGPLLTILKKRQQQKCSRKRKKSRLPDYHQSDWGRMLRDPNVSDLNTDVGKQFLNLFRIPFVLMTNVLVPQCVAVNVFEQSGVSKIPVEIKVMVALRILGRNGCSDGCIEGSFVAKSTATELFRKFVQNYNLHYYNSSVRLPTGDHILKLKEEYKQIGFPGCIGSMDTTRIYCRMTSKDQYHASGGEDFYSSLSFNAVVNHDSRCVHISECGDNLPSGIIVNGEDKNALQIFSENIKKGTYALYNSDGSPKVYEGLYLISEKNYADNCLCLQPLKKVQTFNEMMWNEWCRSILKDVEKFFEVLKNRFRYLKNGNSYHFPSLIVNAIRTATILHNMLVDYDGLHYANSKISWSNLDPDGVINFAEANILENDNSSVQSNMDVEISLRTDILSQTSSTVTTNATFEMGGIFHRENKLQLAEALVIHFNHQNTLGTLSWPKLMEPRQRCNFPIQKPDNRETAERRSALYVRDSDHLAMDKNGITYTSRIGKGLFSCMSYKKNDIICYFTGKPGGKKALAKSYRKGRHGYAIHFNKVKHLDCYDSCKKGLCLASYANSSRRVRNKYDLDLIVIPNCTISVDPVNETACLKATCNIHPHHELITSYHAKYDYPSPEN
jgi:hypothetical protein